MKKLFCILLSLGLSLCLMGAGYRSGKYTIQMQVTDVQGETSVVPTAMVIDSEVAVATILWTNDAFDTMVIDGKEYKVARTDQGAEFTVPVALDTELSVSLSGVDAAAEYQLYFDSSTLESSNGGILYILVAVLLFFAATKAISAGIRPKNG